MIEGVLFPIGNGYMLHWSTKYLFFGNKVFVEDTDAVSETLYERIPFLAVGMYPNSRKTCLLLKALGNRANVYVFLCEFRGLASGNSQRWSIVVL
jgi:hypothetical protein